MRFGQNLEISCIPEWKQCYINYEVLKIFIMIIKQIVDCLSAIQDTKKDITYAQEKCQEHHEMALLEISKEELQYVEKQLQEKLQKMNHLFYQIYTKQVGILEMFYQLKVLEMEGKYNVCDELSHKKVSPELKPLFLSFIEYIYIETAYVSQMRQINIEAERKILKKHKKYIKKRGSTPTPSHQKITRMASIEQDYINKIQDLYVKEQTQHETKVARQFLRLSAQKIETKSQDYFLFGLWIGISLTILGVLIFIIAYSQLSIENSSVFSRDFPVWRGAGIFIIYIWVLGGNTYIFEKYKISHRLIFKYDDHHYSTSTDIFRLAGSFTTIFMLLFLIYLLQITNIIAQNSKFVPQYLPAIIWSFLILYCVVPLPILNYQGRLYTIKLMFQSIISPIVGVSFAINWMTDQWISLNTPLRDLAYTVCFYTDLNFNDLVNNTCKNNSKFEVVALAGVIALSYRVLQCIRLGISEGTYFNSRHFINSLKYTTSLISTVSSFVYNGGSSSFLVIWIISSVISTIFSFLWDLKMDWGLLTLNCRNTLLRKYLTFDSKKLYYVIMSVNFIMRCVWTFTLSPDITKLFGNASLFTLATGSIEIIRRGIWNVLRVEKQHVINCNDFKAIPDTKDIQTKLRNLNQTDYFQVLLVKYIDNMTDSKEKLKKEFHAMLLEQIAEREVLERHYNQDFQERELLNLKEFSTRVKHIKTKTKSMIK